MLGWGCVCCCFCLFGVFSAKLEKAYLSEKIKQEDKRTSSHSFPVHFPLASRHHTRAHVLFHGLSTVNFRSLRAIMNNFPDAYGQHDQLRAVAIRSGPLRSTVTFGNYERSHSETKHSPHCVPIRSSSCSSSSDGSRVKIV